MDKSYKTASQPQLLLRKTIDETKTFFQKTLQSLKSFLFGGYQKLPKVSLVSPFSGSNSDPKMQELDNFYRDFCEHWESGSNSVMKKTRTISAKEPVDEEDVSNERSMNEAKQTVEKNAKENRGHEEKTTMAYNEEQTREPCFQSATGGVHALAQKMKELEMIDVNDVDHVLDIEEVLHYYSRITCPVYLNIVDKFSMDMYSEFFLQKTSPSVSTFQSELAL